MDRKGKKITLLVYHDRLKLFRRRPDNLCSTSKQDTVTSNIEHPDLDGEDKSAIEHINVKDDNEEEVRNQQQDESTEDGSSEDDDMSESTDEGENEAIGQPNDAEPPTLRCSSRNVRPPSHLRDYVTGDSV